MAILGAVELGVDQVGNTPYGKAVIKGFKELPPVQAAGEALHKVGRAVDVVEQGVQRVDEGIAKTEFGQAVNNTLADLVKVRETIESEAKKTREDVADIIAGKSGDGTTEIPQEPKVMVENTISGGISFESPKARKRTRLIAKETADNPEGVGERGKIVYLTGDTVAKNTNGTEALIPVEFNAGQWYGNMAREAMDQGFVPVLRSGLIHDHPDWDLSEQRQGGTLLFIISPDNPNKTMGQEAAYDWERDHGNTAFHAWMEKNADRFGFTQVDAQQYPFAWKHDGRDGAITRVRAK